jgi:hypothetical protein
MKRYRTSRIRRWPNLAAVLALLATLSLASAVGAQESGEVTITASVNNRFLTMTLCETTADFGSGLNAKGVTPFETTDNVVATDEGANPGEGVFYRWTPNSEAPPCSTGSGIFYFALVDSSHAFTMDQCATENSGSNLDLSVAGGDLRAEFDLPPQTFYDAAATIAAVQVCPTTLGASYSFGFRAIQNHVYLRIDDEVDNGTFDSTLVVTATQ